MQDTSALGRQGTPAFAAAYDSVSNYSLLMGSPPAGGAPAVSTGTRTPDESATASDGGAPTPRPLPRASGNPQGRKILLAVLALLAAGGAWMVSHWGLEETDNAQLQADLTEISSRVAGTIVRVPVQDNQQVQAGDLLVLLDPRDARARLLQAQADLVAAEREAQALRAQAGSSASRADAAGNEALAAQQSAGGELARAAANLRRLESLVREGGVSQQEVDQARATFLKAQGEFTSSRASRQTAQASLSQVGVDVQKAGAAAAKVQQAAAAMARARLELSYAQIVAPTPGRIGARNAEPGRQVQPGEPLMTLVSSTPWVEANFKETQLQALYPGQSAEVRLDAFPGRVLQGRVVSIAPASGARFALLPPENATGNFTK
ncbi:MAG: HlyD family secretion protein, partial [Cyanobacteria bacterium]|nr:HlyD family secretion protein [Cyanobacteriota bacterium]